MLLNQGRMCSILFENSIVGITNHAIADDQIEIDER